MKEKSQHKRAAKERGKNKKKSAFRMFRNSLQFFFKTFLKTGFSAILSWFHPEATFQAKRSREQAGLRTALSQL